MYKKQIALIIVFLLVLILPMIGSYLQFHGMPAGYGEFPAQLPPSKQVPPFNMTVFIIFCIIEGIVYLFLLFPQLFGFRTVHHSAVDTSAAVAFPFWFFPGLVVMLGSWALMWIRFPHPLFIQHFAFVPLWWGFILVLDGITYKRNHGKSLISTHGHTVKLLALVSVFSWFVFEFLNFFALENWYYPNPKLLTNFGNITWQLFSYTTVLPAIFEWYALLVTFKFFKHRYKNGPKITLSNTWQWILMIVGLFVMFLMGYFPNQLFWLLWVSLIPAMVPAMQLLKVWTPFTPISSKGDWTFVSIIGIATFLNGIVWEFWNYGSTYFHQDFPTNPNYWKYSVPYVDVPIPFSEMPLMGYCGYVLFGMVCWILWLFGAYIMGFDHRIVGNDQIEA